MDNNHRCLLTILTSSMLEKLRTNRFTLTTVAESVSKKKDKYVTKKPQKVWHWCRPIKKLYHGRQRRFTRKSCPRNFLHFLPRAKLKGPKRTFVVVVLVVLLVGLQMEQKRARKQKMCKGTKNVPISQNKVHNSQMEAKWHIMAHNGIESQCLHYKAFYGILWPHMVLLLFTAIAMFGGLFELAWPCVT